MHFIPENLKFLRKQRGWTQDQMAKQLGVKRSLIGAYEEGRSDPRISFLVLVCQKFNVSMDLLVSKRLDLKDQKIVDFKGTTLRVLPIAISDSDLNERATLVPEKAAAGYLSGYSDVEYIESLPAFELPYPELSKDKTYRVFQIKGDSMLPILPGSYIIASFVLDWHSVKNDQLYVVVSKSEGVVFKRLLNELSSGRFILKSDNPLYPPTALNAEEVIEIWKAEGLTSFTMDFSQDFSSNLQSTLAGIQSSLEELKRRL